MWSKPALLLLLWGAATGCGGELTRPVFAAPHVLSGDWIGATDSYGVQLKLSVKDSTRTDPSGTIPSKFVRGTGRYSLFANGAEDNFTVPPYEVRFQGQLEPFTLTLWTYTAGNGTQRRLEFRGVVESSTRLSGWLVRTSTLPNSTVQKDSAALVLLRDGT